MTSMATRGRRTAVSSGRLQKDGGAQDELAEVRRPSLLMAASSGDWEELLEEVLGKEEGAAVASLLARDIVIDIAGEQGHSDGEQVLTTEPAASALHVVAAAGDGERYLQSARVICRRAPRLLTAPDGDGDTPLHCAARARNKAMVARLMELAAAEGDEEQGGGGGGREKVRALLRMQNARGETALHEAVRFGDREMVDLLVNKDKELARVVAKDGTSPLYLACSLVLHKIAAKLHEADDELSYSGPNGQNALHVAALQDKEMTRWLLQWNGRALVKQRDIEGSTPMHFAASAPDPSLAFTYFVFTARQFEGFSFGSLLLRLPLRWLTAYCNSLDLPLAQLLRADPASAFQPDAAGGSFPVHVAASAGSMASIIALLTRYPGCAGLRDAAGRTFLHVAVERRRLDVVVFVSRYGEGGSWRSAVLNAQDKDGNTALHLAVMAGELKIFRCLMRNPEAHINLQNKDGKTPLDLAQGKVQAGFYFGLTAPRRILGLLTSASALTADRRRDRIGEYDQRLTEEQEKEESKKITQFAQIVGIGSVLVATVTFAAVFTMPGGFRTLEDAKAPPGPPANTGAAAPPPAGTPVLAGSYAFDGFVISNTLAFICSTLATFTLVYCGVAAVDIQRRITVVSLALVLLLSAARSFCLAFGFSLYLLLHRVERGTTIASIAMTSLVMLDGLWFLVASYHDTEAILRRRRARLQAPRLVLGFLANVGYLCVPYLVIFGYLMLDDMVISPRV
ncbi:hypothetical protein ACP4OV_030893 [Aristida adscensionis]